MSIEITLSIVFLLVGIPAIVGYLIFLERKKRDANPNYYNPQKEEKAREITQLEKHILYVAVEFENTDKFSERAKEISLILDYEEATKLIDYFHNNPPVPEELKQSLSKYGVLGVWMEVCQNSIFEILYNYKQKSLPLLFKIGFGQYDWTQHKAIYLLLRLAKENVEKDKIISELREFSLKTNDGELKEKIETEIDSC